MVITSSQTRKGLQPLPDLDDELCQEGGKARKIRHQHRRDKKAGTPVPGLQQQERLPIDSQWQIPDNIRELQASDPTLKPLFQKVTRIDGNQVIGDWSLNSERYILEKDISYLADSQGTQLTVHKPCTLPTQSCGLDTWVNRKPMLDPQPGFIGQIYRAYKTTVISLPNVTGPPQK